MGLKAHIQTRNEEFFKISAAAIQSIESGATASEQQFHDYIRELLVSIIDTTVAELKGKLVRFT